MGVRSGGVLPKQDVNIVALEVGRGTWFRKYTCGQMGVGGRVADLPGECKGHAHRTSLSTTCSVTPATW
eukprot:708044-Alexandrium_andersonii.AAC.1